MNQNTFKDKNDSGNIMKDGRENEHNEALQKFSICLNLGHIPVNKVNSTVKNRRVNIFGDQSVMTKNESGMTINVFHGFYSKFNLPPHVDPDSLRLVLGHHTVTINGVQHKLKIINSEKHHQPSTLNQQENNSNVQNPMVLKNDAEQNPHSSIAMMDQTTNTYPQTDLKANENLPFLPPALVAKIQRAFEQQIIPLAPNLAITAPPDALKPETDTSSPPQSLLDSLAISMLEMNGNLQNEQTNRQPDEKSTRRRFKIFDQSGQMYVIEMRKVCM